MTLRYRLHQSGTLSPAWTGNSTKTTADVLQNSGENGLSEISPVCVLLKHHLNHYVHTYTVD